MKNKILVYPFDKENLPIIEFSQMLNDFQIVSLVSLTGWGGIGTSYILDGKILNVTEKIDEELKKCTAVWFVQNTKKLSFKKHILPVIQKSLEKGKKILYTRNMENNKESKLINEVIPIESKIEIDKYEDPYKEYFNSDSIYDIKTPIVVVCNLFENLDENFIQLGLREQFLKREIKITQIGTSNESELFGIHSLPEFLFMQGISEKDKILKFNHYIKGLEMKENPELIILGVPGNVIEFTDKIIGTFGVCAFEIFKTVKPDCTILCLPYMENLVENIGTIKNRVESIYEIVIDYFHISPKIIDSSEVNLKNRMAYLSLDEKFVRDRIDFEKYSNLFSLQTKKSIENIVNSIIDQLKKNTSIKVV